jgi:uncharacterized protein (TIGR02444 family)
MEQCLMDFPPHPFWDFALEVYRRPGVSDACLTLQERHQVDVNLLLFVCWVGACGGGRLSRDEVVRCREAVAPWHDSIVRPLRGVRRILKGGLGDAPQELSDGLRRAIQAREIDAEHIEQLMLAQTVHREPNPGIPLAERLDHASRNALTYLAVLDAGADPSAQKDLAVILGAAFIDAEPSMVVAALALAA